MVPAIRKRIRSSGHAFPEPLSNGRADRGVVVVVVVAVIAILLLGIYSFTIIQLYSRVSSDE